MDRGRKLVSVGILLLGLAIGGCAVATRMPSYEKSQFQLMIASETLRETDQTWGEVSEKQVQDEVERLLALKPRSAVPRKLALYEVSSSGRSRMESPAKLLELRASTSRMMKQALQESGIFEEVEFLPDILVPRHQGDGASQKPLDLKTLRIAAARAQADGLLIYSTEAGYELQANPLAVLYVTIVGAFMVPGTKETSIALSKGALVDVATGYVYLTKEASATRSSRWWPGPLIDYQQVELEARSEALQELSQILAARIKEMK